MIVWVRVGCGEGGVVALVGRFANRPYVGGLDRWTGMGVAVAKGRGCVGGLVGVPAPPRALTPISRPTGEGECLWRNRSWWFGW